jgi:hypothetical protein
MKECRVISTSMVHGDDLQRILEKEYNDGWSLRGTLPGRGENLLILEKSTEDVLHIERLPVIQEEEGPRYVGLHTQALVNDAMAVRRLAGYHRISGIKRIEGERHPDRPSAWIKKPGWQVTIPFPNPDSTESRTVEAVSLGLACDNAKSYLEMSRKEKPVSSE